MADIISLTVIFLWSVAATLSGYGGYKRDNRYIGYGLSLFLLGRVIYNFIGGK